MCEMATSDGIKKKKEKNLKISQEIMRGSFLKYCFVSTLTKSTIYCDDFCFLIFSLKNRFFLYINNILGHSSAITRLSFLPDAARLISIGTRLKKGDISLGQSGNTVSIGTRLDEAATFLWGQPVNTLFAD